MKTTVGRAAPWLLSGALLALGAAAARAADDAQVAEAPVSAQPAPPPAGQPEPPTQAAQPAQGKPAEAPATWLGSVKFSAQIEGGIIVNPDRPNNGINFGQLFTDRANQVELNQILLGVQRPIDPKATDYDFGFQLQALYGADARYTQFLGEMNYSFASRYQLAIIAANLQAHLPWLTPGGIDLKAGQYPTPLGFETIDPSTNPFYSHSYIFNFGLPLKHTGAYATLHLTDVVDLYAGVDTGVNTTVSLRGDNNGTMGGLGGIGLNLLGGDLTILWLSHFGPENAVTTTPFANSRYRVYNDVYGTYKWNDKFTTTTELDWVHDALVPSNAWGVAQYGSYALSDNVTLNGRVEVFRDDTGFFVGGFRGNFAFQSFSFGYTDLPLPDPSVYGFGANTYGALTLGVTWKPNLAPFSTLMIRPEIRWDHAFVDTRPFNSNSSNNQFLASVDLILGF
jgi:hypothetical protein